MTGTNLLTGAVPLSLSIPTVVEPPPAPTVNAPAPVSLAAISPTQIASTLPAQITPSNPIGSGSKIISAGLQSPISSLVSRQLRIGTANDKARTIGLNPNEVQRLDDYLNGLSDADFTRELQLVNDAVSSDNPDRAMRTYVDLTSQRTYAPTRITPDIARSLVMGVGRARTSASEGQDGVLGENGALRAAITLVSMPQADYDRIASALGAAGGSNRFSQIITASPTILKPLSASVQPAPAGASTSTGTGTPSSTFAPLPSGALTLPASVIVPRPDPETERALILKAVAAREQAYSQMTPDQTAKAASTPDAQTSQILQFAKDIHGVDREMLVEQTTYVDVNGDSVNDGLKQRWSNSCVPTTSEIMLSDNDPIWAWQHSGQRYSTSNTDYFGNQQAQTLRNAGVTPGTSSGMTATPALDSIVTPATDTGYKMYLFKDTQADRTSAMNQMEASLKHGIDVPVGIGWGAKDKNGNEVNGHVELVTDVRGSGPNREFLFSDPATGHTGWVSESDILTGSTNFFGVTGRLREINLNG